MNTDFSYMLFKLLNFAYTFASTRGRMSGGVVGIALHTSIMYVATVNKQTVLI